MFDHPYLQTIIAEYETQITPARRHSVGGVACPADQSRAIRRVAQLHDADEAEVRRWLTEAGVAK